MPSHFFPIKLDQSIILKTNIALSNFLFPSFSRHFPGLGNLGIILVSMNLVCVTIKVDVFTKRLVLYFTATP